MIIHTHVRKLILREADMKTGVIGRGEGEGGLHIQWLYQSITWRCLRHNGWRVFQVVVTAGDGVEGPIPLDGFLVDKPPLYWGQFTVFKAREIGVFK